MNRNYPDPHSSAHPDGNSYQSETEWFMQLAEDYPFTMAASFHGGAEVVNYPWDNTSTRHADDAWWQYVSQEYANLCHAVSSSYMTTANSQGDTPSGITNGAAWYMIGGGHQDYMNGYHQCREVTVECSNTKNPSASQLPTFWNYNHNSMLAYMEQCLNGIHGVVRDAITNQIIEGATVTVQNHDDEYSIVSTQEDGYFHRPIKGGTWTLEVSKSGYHTETVNVTVADDQSENITVYLTPYGPNEMECYELVMPTTAGDYVMGNLNGSSLVMPTHNNISTVTTTSLDVTATDNGFSVIAGTTIPEVTLTACGNDQYYISYNGRYLARSFGKLTWGTSQSTRWTINSSGIYTTSNNNNYYLYYDSSFKFSDTQQNNITFYCLSTISATAYPAEGGTVAGTGTYEQGNTCTLTATPATYYTFVNWTEGNNVVSTDASYSFTVTSERILVANFELDGFHFITAGDWNNPANWFGNTLPGTDDAATIHANCALNQDATVASLTIENGKTLTVQSGQTLIVTGTLTNAAAENLVVADGGQLVTSNAVLGTVQKSIDAYTSNNDGWNFIASPVTTSLTAANVSGLIPSGNTIYDFYYLEEASSKWRNYKPNNEHSGFDVEHNKGYLYANDEGTTINFSGTLQPYVATGATINLAKTGDGWNLVGNPFTFNAYVDKSYYVINGRNIEPTTGGAIAPCTGIVVKATSGSETVTFTKNNPSANSNQGNLNIVVAEQVTTRDGASTGSMVDKAIVSFNEGNQLSKFYFGKQNGNIYIPQGNKEYAIVSVGRDVARYVFTEVPVNFKSKENGTYTITVSPENVEMNYLHLIDNMTGTDVDLLVTPNYTFTAKTSDYASRFRLVFSVCGDADGDDENFAFISNGNIIINGEGTVQVIDMTGRIIVSVDGRTRCIPTLGMTPGVYVLRLIDGDNAKTQKIVIQ